jgi:PPOX class probable F420-dependent enzyme
VASVELADVARIGTEDRYLAVVATTRADGTVQASVVNAGILPHPVSGEDVVGFVTYGRAKLANLRLRPRATVVFRSGWRWGAVEGACDIVGPNDPLAGVDASDIPGLLRAIFRAAGGTHDDWAEFDRVMREEQRAAVLVRPERVYSNQGQ